MGWGSLPWSIFRPTHPVLGLAHLKALQCSPFKGFNYTERWKSHTWCSGQAPRVSLFSSGLISSVPNYLTAVFPSVQASPSTWVFIAILNPRLLSFFTEENYHPQIFVFLIKIPQESCVWGTRYFSLCLACVWTSSFWIQCLLSIFETVTSYCVVLSSYAFSSPPLPMDSLLQQGKATRLALTCLDSFPKATSVTHLKSES